MTSTLNLKPTAQIVDPSLSTGFITVVVGGKPMTMRSEGKNFAVALDAIKREDWAALYGLMQPERAIKALSHEGLNVENGVVTFKGEPVHNVVVSKILALIEAGLDAMPSIKFLRKLLENPSRRSVEELYRFLEYKNLPLTENGNFLAYKGVKSDFYDCHSGKFRNKIGDVLEMPRNKVDDDANRGCSYGFHAGTLEYASGFKPSNGHLMIVEINPKDVVSIPHDCSCQKLRTARYKVVAEYTEELTAPVYPSRDIDPRDYDDESIDDEGDYFDSF